MSTQFAIQRIIKDIKNNDEKIQVIGYIKTKANNDNLILDDKTGELKVNIKEIENFNFKENDLVNLIGDLEIQVSGEKILNAHIVQDMNKLNFEYYQQLYELKKELDAS